MRLDDEIGIVQHSKPIHNVSAESWVNILRPVLPNTITVPSPVGEIAHHLEVS